MSLRPVFLHSFWRSGSTWLWNAFRALPECKAYYEPFHEVLATLRTDEIPVIAAGSWQSRHTGVGAPYFAEYQNLFRPEGGCFGYDAAFATQRYFADGESFEAQALWIRSLIEDARKEGRTPVLGFTRSLGRVRALRDAFPDALHVFLLRDPVSTFLSNLSYKHRDNPHFCVGYAEILIAGSARFPEFAKRCKERGFDAEGIQTGANKTRLVEVINASSDEELFEDFILCFRMVLKSCPFADGEVIQFERLDDAGYRRDLESVLRDHTGLPVSLESYARPQHVFPEAFDCSSIGWNLLDGDIPEGNPLAELMMQGFKEAVAHCSETVRARNTVIAEKNLAVAEKDLALSARDLAIVEKDARLENCAAEMARLSAGLSEHGASLKAARADASRLETELEITRAEMNRLRKMLYSASAGTHLYRACRVIVGDANYCRKD